MARVQDTRFKVDEDLDARTSYDRVGLERGILLYESLRTDRVEASSLGQRPAPVRLWLDGLRFRANREVKIRHV